MANLIVSSRPIPNLLNTMPEHGKRMVTRLPAALLPSASITVIHRWMLAIFDLHPVLAPPA
jgi:hypothetical protein